MEKRAKKQAPWHGDIEQPPADRHGALASDAKTLSEEAYVLVKRDVLSGQLAPGSKLLFRHLCERYDIGTAPLREALMQLASERLVTFSGQRGFFVAQISRTELHDVCALWSELSVSALKLSIEQGDSDWEADVLASLHRLVRAPLPASPTDYETIARWEHLHAHFHMSLLAACGSPWRLHFCAVMSAQFERYRRVILLRMATSVPTARKVNDEHRQVAEAAVARDTQRAMQLLSDHFSGSLQFLDAQFEFQRIDETIA